MSEKLSESRVSAIVEAQSCVRAIAGAQLGDTVMRQLDRAARRIPFWRWSRVKDAWYAEQRMRVDSDELEALQELATKFSGRKETPRAKQQSLDIQALEQRLARVEAALRLSNPDAYRALVGEDCASGD